MGSAEQITIVALKQLPEYVPSETETALRWMVHNAHSNGLSGFGAIFRRGRRTMIIVERFKAWLEASANPSGAGSLPSDASIAPVGAAPSGAIWREIPTAMLRGAGVYLVMSGSRVLYVGQSSGNIFHRLSTHANNTGMLESDRMLFVACVPPDSPRDIESALLRLYQPPFNRQIPMKTANFSHDCALLRRYLDVDEAGRYVLPCF